MNTSFCVLFGIDQQNLQFEDDELPMLAHGARQAGQVTAEQQHRWLLMGRALQHKANESVLMPSSALLDYLGTMCDPVEHVLDDVFGGNIQVSHAS